jgi:hypothetical protein
MRRSAAVLLSLVILPLPVLAQDNLGAPLQVPGLSDTVHLFRDGHHIPHIFAKNDSDALFTLGWVHAQDRLFQMDVLRRTFSGTLADRGYSATTIRRPWGRLRSTCPFPSGQRIVSRSAWAAVPIPKWRVRALCDR